jgi:hypothetical protein
MAASRGCSPHNHTTRGKIPHTQKNKDAEAKARRLSVSFFGVLALNGCGNPLLYTSPFLFSLHHHQGPGDSLAHINPGGKWGAGYTRLTHRGWRGCYV